MEKLIKLSDAMDIVMWGNGLDGSIVDNICEKLEALPSADRPKGEWIDIYTILFKAQCSSCGTWSDVMGIYCPWCGARMKGADDE